VRFTGRQRLAAIVTLVVMAAVITGIVILGSPAEERAKRIDLRRVNDLQRMENAVNFYFAERATLPASVEELSKQSGVRIGSDPVTGAAYRYRALDAERFELCGTFDRPSTPRMLTGVNLWEHPAGNHCFSRKVTKQPPK
jgi:hypothetical protein